MKYVAICTLMMVMSTQYSFCQETGTLKARFVYGGEAFSPKPIEVKRDTAFCGSHSLVDERVMINAEDKGLRHVIFHLYTGRGGYRLPLEKRQPVSKTLKAENCRFEPHVIVLQAGDTLEIQDQDAVGHAATPMFFANQLGSFLRSPRGTVSLVLTNSEPGIVPVECAIHPWMRAYIAVLDHPLVDVSDDHGNIEIEGLPVGSRLPFRLFHEAASGIKEVIMDGKTLLLDKSRIELEVKPGMNDFGVITIPQDALKP